MNTDQLKLIIDSINQLQSGAAWVFMAWLAKEVVVSVIGYGVGFYALYKGFDIVKWLVAHFSFQRVLMDEIGTSVYLSPEEQQQIVRLVKLGKKSESEPRTSGQKP